MLKKVLSDKDIRKFDAEADLGRRFDRYYSDQPPCRNCRGAVDEKVPLDVVLNLPSQH